MKIALSIIALILIPLLMTAQAISVMTYNIRYANDNDKQDRWELRKEGVVNLIEHYQPQLFGVQEALYKQIQYLDKALADYDYIGVGRDDGKTKGEFSAIFYKKSEFTVLQQKTFWLSETPSEISVGWDAALERICTYALFENTNGQSFWVFNTHFDHKGKQARINASTLIIETIIEARMQQLAPVILMGDFNLIPTEQPIKHLSDFMSDTRQVSLRKAYGPIGTFNGFNLDRVMKNRIDYIFVKDFQVLTHRHIDDRLPNNRYPSDHLPVYVRLELE